MSLLTETSCLPPHLNKWSPARPAEAEMRRVGGSTAGKKRKAVHETDENKIIGFAFAEPLLHRTFWSTARIAPSRHPLSPPPPSSAHVSAVHSSSVSVCVLVDSAPDSARMAPAENPAMRPCPAYRLPMPLRRAHISTATENLCKFHQLQTPHVDIRLHLTSHIASDILQL